jgi:hypothetical protein
MEVSCYTLLPALKVLYNDVSVYLLCSVAAVSFLVSLQFFYHQIHIHWHLSEHSEVCQYPEKTDYIHSVFHLI